MIPYGSDYSDTDPRAPTDPAISVLEADELSSSENNSSHSSHGGVPGDLLAAVRDGAWLDRQMFPPLGYAVDGLIPEGFSLVIGPPKAGKSWLLVGLLLAVASGGYALGKIRLPAKRPVFYLALEDSDRRMQFRCREIMAGDPIPEMFHYITAAQPSQVINTIDAFLTLHPDTALVVLDTLGKVMPEARAGESAYQRDYRIGGRLKRIADERPGLAVVVVHHDRKAAAEDFVHSVSGTNGLAGSADTIVVLARKRHSADGLLKVTGRDVAEAEYALTKRGSGHWTLDGKDLAEAAATARRRDENTSLGETSTAIIEFVGQHPGGIAAKDIRDRFGAGADTYLQRLTESGRLVKLKRGVYAVPDSNHPPDEPSLEPLEPLDAQVNDANRTPAPTHCTSCGQRLLLIRPGRERCERCDIEQRRSTP